jgi:hypothetical protein
VFRTVQGDLEHDLRRHRWTAAASAAALLAACSSTPTEREVAGPDEVPATEVPAPPTPTDLDADDPGPRADAAPPESTLELTGRQLDGGTFDGSTVTGDVVVWFWTPW